MGLRFRRSLRLGRGLRINLSKSGASVSVSRPGATVNFGPNGEKVTVGLPGTGLSYSQMIAKADGSKRRSQPPSPMPRWLKIFLIIFLGTIGAVTAAGVILAPK